MNTLFKGRILIRFTMGLFVTVAAVTVMNQSLALNLTDTSDNSLLYVEDTGNVGIGTTSPGAKLTLQVNSGDLNFGQSAIHIRGVNRYFDYDAGMIMRGTGAAYAARFTSTSNMGPGGEIVGIYQEEPTPGALGGPIAVFMNDGDVGIGTTNPTRELHVVSNLSGGGIRIESPSAPTFWLKNSGYSTEWNLFVEDGTGKFIMANNTAGQRFFFEPDGKLDVIGTIVSDGLALSRDNENRGAIWFANAGDLNVAMFNNISDIDGEGAWDGIKMNFVSGFDIGYRGDSGRISVMLANRSGNVGIGESNPGNILTVQQNSPTDPIADAWTTYSSKRWKTNIKPIEDALDKVQRLRGVSYDWKANSKHDIGLIAEEVGEVIPEVVAYEENGVDAKSVDYPRLVAVLIEAVKEQQQVIDAQNSELTEMKAEMVQFRAALQRLEALATVRESVDDTEAGEE